MYFDLEVISSDYVFEYDCDFIDYEVFLFLNNFGFMDSYVFGDVEDEFWVDIC